MTDYWITTGSTHPEAVVNPLAAACTEREYVPDEVRVLDNPGVHDQVARTVELLETVVDAHGGTTAVETTRLDDETEFRAVVDHFQSGIEAAGAGDTVAFDVTPGRKFMSAIAFQAGFQFEADHVFYLHVASGDLFGRVYPDLPKTATTLYDFLEVFDG
jgi:hypothetical protein